MWGHSTYAALETISILAGNYYLVQALPGIQCLLADSRTHLRSKAVPEWDLRYFSKERAFDRSLNAMQAINSQRLYRVYSWIGHYCAMLNGC